MKLTELFNERSLTKSEEDKKEDIVKGMKKNKGDFEKRYGKEAKAVMYATATKMAKNEDVNEVLSSKGRENLRRLIHDFERQAEDMNLSDEAMDAVAMGLDQIMSDVQEIEGVRENKTPGDSHYHKEKAKELAKKDGKDPERLSYGELMDYIKKAQQMDSSHNQESVENEGIVEGVALTEAEFDEAAGKKDACYHKVKARYKVWPSAYASGALVQCRKKGAKNWGNSKKK